MKGPEQISCPILPPASGFQSAGKTVHEESLAVPIPVDRVPTFASGSGRMGEDRIREMWEVYGRDCVFILGSQIRELPESIAASCDRFMQRLDKLSGAH